MPHYLSSGMINREDIDFNQYNNESSLIFPSTHTFRYKASKTERKSDLI